MEIKKEYNKLNEEQKKKARVLLNTIGISNEMKLEALKGFSNKK